MFSTTYLQAIDNTGDGRWIDMAERAMSFVFIGEFVSC
jgi:hypothetical protein